jgi:glycosyltransferase involved in cell wall biosynthesis
MNSSHEMALSKFDRSVSLLCWGYDEELLIEDFFNRAFALLEATVEDFEILFVNDGSTDRTGELAEACAKRDPRLKVFHNDRNYNVGTSAYRAIQMATKDVVFWQTIDWSYDLTNLRVFLELTKHFDVVQGIRPVPIRLLAYIPVLRSIYRVKTRSDNLTKAAVSLINYYLLRILFGCKFHDFQNVTFYKRIHVRDIDIRGSRAFSNPKLLLTTYDKGLTYLEVPIRFIPRQRGKAKGVSLRSVTGSLAEISRAWLDWGWRFRLRQMRDNRRRIFRVLEPFHLDENILKLTLPLFKEFR